MKIGAPRETFDGEKRVALTPQSAAALQKLGYACLVESGAGLAARFSDEAYAAAGVTVVADAAALWAEADIVAKVRAPEGTEIDRARPGQIVISFVYPGQNPDLLEALPVPAGLRMILEGFVAQHHKQREFHKRKRDRADTEARGRQAPQESS